MQGVRHDHLSVSDSSKVLNDKRDGFTGNSSMAGLSGTLHDIELNLGSPKGADSLPQNHNRSNETSTK